MRDNKWLKKELEEIWQRYFSDIEIKNPVYIKFGRRARTRLGSIREIKNSSTLLGINKKSVIKKLISNSLSSVHKSSSLVTINGLFKDEKIPKFVIQATISHELIHYAHGFSSPHEKTQDYPHYGGVIKKEMESRGLLDIFILQKKWLKENWKSYIKKNLPHKVSHRRRRRRKIIIIKSRRWF